MARSIIGQGVETSFDRGVKKFTWLIIRFMMVMVPLVFLINGLTKHDWKEAFFFSLAVAVGTDAGNAADDRVGLPIEGGDLHVAQESHRQAPAIPFRTSARWMCCARTRPGTLTMDHVILERHCDVVREEDDNVLQAAYLISHFQTGLKNVLDRAILSTEGTHGDCRSNSTGWWMKSRLISRDE